MPVEMPLHLYASLNNWIQTAIDELGDHPSDAKVYLELALGLLNDEPALVEMSIKAYKEQEEYYAE
jgi:hypothetical protein